jgi:hypothetical protein
MAESVVDYPTLKTKIRELEGSVLTDAMHKIAERSLDLRFKHWDGRTLTVHCDDVVLCNVSMLDSKSGDSEVIGARLDVLESGCRGVLEKNGYLWDTTQAQEESLSYPLFHLALSGDACVAVVCGSVDFQ